MVYDALVSPEIMALANPRAEKINVGKRGSKHTLEQSGINRLLEELAKAGKTVLRMKGGDPYLFGRGAEEALHLVEHGVNVEVVPGVTAGIAAAACAGIPVTHRDCASAVAFVTGHEDPTKPESRLDWESLAKVGTLCFYMGIKNLGQIAAGLGRYLPMETPAAVIQWGSTPRQRTAVGTLATIEQIVREMKIQAPAMTVVGQVVRYRGQLNFFERRTLFGARIVVTRARAQASDLSAALCELGAQVFEFPTIRIVPEGQELAGAVARLADGGFDWLVLTSVNGVDALFGELARRELDARAVRAKVAAIGSATSRRLAENGIRADLVPPEYIAESIAATLRERNEIAGKRFLLARADIARSALPELLKQGGADVSDVVAYRTLLETEGQEAALAALEHGEVDAVTFTSASTARNFSQVLGQEKLKKLVAGGRTHFLSIGPQTSAAMKDVGLPVHGEAHTHDIPALVELARHVVGGR
jgi:uroporphyrinogen III methyltransferase/synthase